MLTSRTTEGHLLNSGALMDGRILDLQCLTTELIDNSH
jgi:hypothetical protein